MTLSGPTETANLSWIARFPKRGEDGGEVVASFSCNGGR